MTRRKETGREGEGQSSLLVWFLRLGVLFVALLGVAMAILMLVGRWQNAGSGGATTISSGSSELNALERFYLRSYLSSKREQLGAAVGSGTAPIAFIISPGERADQIAANLAEAGLLRDEELFRNYVRYNGLDSRLEAGTYKISPTLSMIELADTLTRAIAQELEITFLEGWRLTEMVEQLAVTTPGSIEADIFLETALRDRPIPLSGYNFLNSLPEYASLEGFLFPDTYRVAADTEAEDLIQQMLENFGSRLRPELRQSYGVHGLTVFQAVTLASIVEREAVRAEERPYVASVFLNRLAQGMRLEADPTVQYSLGLQNDGKWWKSPLFLEDLAHDSPYNTYKYGGLPPGPIANPGLASLEAVANPAQTDYLFFVADCTDERPGTHVFNQTYEEHLVQVERCRQ